MANVYRVASGASATVTVTEQQTITLNNRISDKARMAIATGPGAGRVVADNHIGRRVYGPFGAGTVTISAISGDVTYELSGDNSEELTQDALIAMAEADALQPGVTYRMTNGAMAVALTERFLQPLGPWFVDGRRWSVGSATSATDLTYCYLPPLAPNAQVDIWHQWSMDATNVTKRARIYLDGTLGGGVTGAQAVYTRNFTDATTVMFPSYHRVTNRNDASSQLCQGIGDSAVFGLSTSTPVALTVSTNTSKLLRAMGETSKSGSNVTITTLTRSGSTATAAVTSHGLSTGDYIGVTGAAQTEYNVDPVAITVVDANSFTYPITGTPTTPATGTPVYQKYVSLALVSFRVEVRQGLGF